MNGRRRPWGLSAGRPVTVLAATTVLLATTLPILGSNASWRDDEYDHATLGTLDCADDNIVASRAAGKLFGGSMLEADLDEVAELTSMRVTNDGAAAHPDPATATQVALAAGTNPGGLDVAWRNPLGVEVLDTVNVPLTGTSLAGFLQLDTGTGTGVLNQFAGAGSNGYSLGASGGVSDSGAVSLSRDANGNAPTLGTMRLSTLVEKLTGTALASVVSGVSDLSLEVGAVAGRATLDACEAEWTNDVAAHLDRSYAVAALSAELATEVVKELGVTAGRALDSVQLVADTIDDDSAEVDSEIGDGVRDEIQTGVTGLLEPVLGGLTIGGITVLGPAVSLDLATVRGLTTETITDDTGTVALNLATGQVSVDLAALLGEAYGGEGFDGQPGRGLNALDPNTELVLNARVTNALVASLEQALDDWVADMVASVKTAVSAATAEAEIVVMLRGRVLGLTLDVARLDIRTGGTLSQLIADAAQTDATVTVLDDVADPLLAEAIRALVAPLAPTLEATAEDGTAPLVGTAVQKVLDAAANQVGVELTTASGPVVTTLAAVLNDYLGVNGLVSLKVNAQNDPITGPGTYPDWESGNRQVRDGRYDVAALSVGVLDAGDPRTTVHLELGRASVGVSCLLGGALHQSGACAGY
jgi:hypothetical protein